MKITDEDIASLLSSLRRIADSLERIAHSVAGPGGDEDPPGVAESITVLTSAVLEMVDLERVPDEMSAQKPS